MGLMATIITKNKIVDSIKELARVEKIGCQEPE
jgi:hypothetical protein